MEPQEVLQEVLLPLVGRRTTAAFLKPEASLKDDSTLSLACTARTTADGQIKHANLMVGGLTSFVPLTLTAAALCAGDGPATAQVFADLGELLSPSAIGGRTEYRRTLALSLVEQAETILRGTEPMEGEPPQPAQQSVKPGSWRFPQADGAFPPVGQPLSKLDSSGVTTGEAEFVDDIPSPAGCLHLAYVLSREPRATIRGVDTTKAMQVPGVRLWLTDSDSKREGCFAWNSSLGTGSVSHVGQLIGAFAADTPAAARSAAGLVEVSYESLEDAPILTMNEALEAGSILPVPPTQPTMGICPNIDLAPVTRLICFGGQVPVRKATWRKPSSPPPESSKASWRWGGKSISTSCVKIGIFLKLFPPVLLIENRTTGTFRVPVRARAPWRRRATDPHALLPISRRKPARSGDCTRRWTARSCGQGPAAGGRVWRESWQHVRSGRRCSYSGH